MSKRLSFATLAVALPLAFASPVAHAATPADTVVIAKQIDDILTLDPGEAYELSGIEIATNIYDRLLRYEAEDVTKLVGGVAESWTISPDGKVYNFKLRPNLKFQSGAPVTAEDVAFSLQRVVLMNKTPAFLFTQLGWTKDNVKDLVKATGPNALQVTITEDFAPSLVLNLMTSIVASVVEKKVAMANEVNGDLGNAWLKSHSAASGAYRLVAWKPNESVTLEANPTFRLGAPAMKRVVVRHVPEPASQRLLLEKGDIDIARDLSPDQLAPLAENKAIRIEQFPGANTWYAAMNTADEHLKNPKVREAMKYLVDYNGMVNSFLKGRFIVQESFLPLGFFSAIAYNPYKLDVAKAKALLAEAGYPNGFELKFDAPNTSPFTEIAQSMQQTMGQAGIKLNIVPSELKQVIGVYRARKHQLLLISWGPDYFDPHTNADTFAHNDDNSDTPKVRPLAWRNHWYIPDVTKDMLAAAKELDTKKRAAMYADLQRKVTDEGPFIIMFQNTAEVASRANVKGFKGGITEDLNFYRTIKK
ncbi:ABC transporter substrate-binding protein [Limobrevibacterium gyesilva]|uniref:ABC transporter substrate-binding protein n=1 Tax=Limobrevibacterium gyesilva TaxID=2991712 RepID=A0AA41YPG6_9PROT|nr:ABC transporter substrate-binding protein [Limobrevibacterium gyesilva]MCW3475843.1 ABC transporter substrate-binding protein [Limobrevibacterium gyesilva]